MKDLTTLEMAEILVYLGNSYRDGFIKYLRQQGQLEAEQDSSILKPNQNPVCEQDGIKLYGKDQFQ